MKNLRMLLAAALALCGAGMTRAQTPAPLVDPIPMGAVPAADAPSVVIGDRASSSVPKMWYELGWGAYWVTTASTPPLLTTSAVGDNGVLGSPSTAVLLGQDSISYGTFFGISFTSGGWWNAERTIGMDGSTLWSEQRAIRARFDSANIDPLFRPIIDPAARAESSLLVSSPGLAAGVFLYESRFKFVNGDSNLMLNCYRDEERSITALVGYRTMYIREELRMTQVSTALADDVLFFRGQPLVTGDQVTIRDRIETVNRYYMAQVGLRWERTNGAVTGDLTGKLAFGWANERIYADGRTTLEPNAVTVAGGALVQQSFPYRNQLEEFAFVPSFGAHVSIRLRARLRLTGGYDFSWVNRVARPGAYLGRTVELTQVPTSAQFTGVVGTQPAFARSDSSMFLNGLTVGLRWQY